MWNWIGRLPGMERAFLRSDYGQRALEKARQVEAAAWVLAGQQPPPAGDDLLAVLSAAARLLETARVRPATGDAETRAPAEAPSPDAAPTPVEAVPPPVAAQSQDAANVRERSIPVEAPPPAASPMSNSAEPPAYVQDLVRLLDWLAVSATGAIPAGAHKHLSRELSRILTGAGVTVLTEGGAFNAEQQQVVDVEPTSDSSRIDTVSRTVRAGYRYGDTLLRPQEVILYSSPSDPAAPP